MVDGWINRYLIIFEVFLNYIYKHSGLFCFLETQKNLLCPTKIRNSFLFRFLFYRSLTWFWNSFRLMNGRMDGFLGGLVGWLPDWLIGGLIDWLIVTCRKKRCWVISWTSSSETSCNIHFIKTFGFVIYK